MSPLNALPTTATGTTRARWPKDSVGASPNRGGSGRAHHDQRHGEHGDDRIERRCSFDLSHTNQELSERKSEERADHVDREDPPALCRPGFSIEPALGGNKESAASEANDHAQQQPGQWSAP